MSKKKYVEPQLSRKQLENELRIINAKLWLANEKLKEEERIKTEFFANVSHDLRAPLMALSGSLEYLLSDDVSIEEQNEILHLMSRRMNALKQMVEDMFLLSKVDNRDMLLKTEPINMAMFLEEYFFSCKADPAYDERELCLKLSEGADREIMIDPNMMLRVMDNLFTNARKYSERFSRITLFAEIVSEGAHLKELGDERNTFFCIGVEDEGVGISEQNLPHIFERTFRVDKSRNPEDGSSGLGLAITKGIVERHGGTIRCESKVGEGTRFIVLLPIE